MTRRRQAASFGVVVFAVLHVAVVVLPAAAIALAARKGGLPGLHGFDLVATSLVVGIGHAAVVWRRLRAELREVDVRIDAFIAAFNALVVLAALATGLVLVLLGGFAPEHAAIVNHGWPVVGSWVVGLLVAVGAAELVRTGILRWLEPGVQV